jgi:uncharacterized protein
VEQLKPFWLMQILAISPFILLKQHIPMKKLFTITFLLLLAAFSDAQDITGPWNGTLDIQGTQLRIVFHIEKSGSGYTATMDSPDQGAYGIPVTSTEMLTSNTLRIIADKLRMEYTGTVISDSLINGTFKQAGMSLPLNLSRKEIPARVVVRKQDPKQPFPYRSEEVTFENQTEHFTLAGTITIPAKPGRYPAVVLVSGSGSQNRNEEIFNHRPFLVLSDYLTRNGIVVLRYDDRGTGASKGDAEEATSPMLAGDAMAAVNLLKAHPSVDPKRIGIIGHSEGGMIAPMVANQSDAVAFIVLLAGPGIPGDELLLLQSELISRAGGEKEEEISKALALNRSLYNLIISEKDTNVLSTGIKSLLSDYLKENPEALKTSGMTENDFMDVQMKSMMLPWIRYFISYHPENELEKVKCPVLALNGARDLQVPARENLQGIEKALKEGGNTHYTLKKYPRLNHLFQTCKTGHPGEYGKIGQTFSPKVMRDIVRWISSL